MLNRTLATGLLVATGMAGTLCARAADMPALFPQTAYQDAVPPAEMEFGTGWYLRGDLTASNDVEPDVLGTLAPTSDRREWGYGVGGGGGYKFNEYFRADITGDYLSTEKRSGTNAATGAFSSAKLQRWDGLVNGYIDLGNWYGITPYIGGGVGFAALTSSGNLAPAGGALTKFSTKEQYNLAWAAMAGVAYNISPHLLLDVGYRYLDLGRFTSRFSGDKTDLNAHEVRVGVRYQID